MLADGGRLQLAAVAVSHTVEVHIGGVEEVVWHSRVERLLLPVWMPSEVAAVALLRTTRSRAMVPLVVGCTHLYLCALLAVLGCPP
jgi:hypothetical protein